MEVLAGVLALHRKFSHVGGCINLIFFSWQNECLKSINDDVGDYLKCIIHNLITKLCGFTIYKMTLSFDSCKLKPIKIQNALLGALEQKYTCSWNCYYEFTYKVTKQNMKPTHRDTATLYDTQWAAHSYYFSYTKAYQLPPLIHDLLNLCSVTLQSG